MISLEETSETSTISDFFRISTHTHATKISNCTLYIRTYVVRVRDLGSLWVLTNLLYALRKTQERRHRKQNPETVLFLGQDCIMKPRILFDLTMNSYCNFSFCPFGFLTRSLKIISCQPDILVHCRFATEG